MGNYFEVNGSTGVVNFKQKGTSQLVLESGTSFPASPVANQIFYRTDVSQLYAYSGTSWTALNSYNQRIYNETPSGAVNGSNTVFTTANLFIAGSTTVTRDGLILQGGGVDYTETPSTSTITFVTAPASGSTLLVSYNVSNGSTLPSLNRISYITGTPSGTYTGSTTIFNLPWTYVQNTGSLLVWSSGVLMIAGASADYQETSTSSITFNVARPTGELIQFIKLGVAQDIASASTIRVADSTASSPNLSFQTDINTGIYHSTSDTLGFATNGTSALLLDTSQNAIFYGGVGIGATPTTKLYIESSVPIIRMRNTTGSGSHGLEMYSSGNNLRSGIYLNEDNGSLDINMDVASNTWGIRFQTTPTAGSLTTVATMMGSGATTFNGTVTINSAANPALLVQGSSNGISPRMKVVNTNSTSGQTRTSIVGAFGSDLNGVALTGGYDSSNNAIQMVSGDSYLQLGVGGVEFARVTSGSQLLMVGSGTISAPAYAFSSNQTSGMWMNGSNLALSAGGSGGLNITSSGQLSPFTDQGQKLGSASARWLAIYGPLVGTTTNDNATAGNVGEFIRSSVTTPVNAPATLQFFDITSISLTAGDWDITGQIICVLNGATQTVALTAITSTSGNSVTGQVDGDNRLTASIPTANNNSSSTIACYRVSLASTTTYYLKARLDFSAGTPQAYGRISARRMR